MNENQNNEVLNENNIASEGATEAVPEKPTKKKSKKKTLLIILPIVIVAILAIAALIIWQEVATHFCSAPGCSNWEMAKGYSYCAEHTCNCADCKAPKADDSNYCEEHTCAYTDCTELTLKDAKACEEHLCESRGCTLSAYRDGFCTQHYSENKKEETHSDKVRSFEETRARIDEILASIGAEKCKVTVITDNKESDEVHSYSVSCLNDSVKLVISEKNGQVNMIATTFPKSLIPTDSEEKITNAFYNLSMLTTASLPDEQAKHLTEKCFESVAESPNDIKSLGYGWKLTWILSTAGMMTLMPA